MLKRVLLFAALGSGLAFAQTSPETAPLPEQQATPLATPQATPEQENQNSGGVVDEIERVLREKENAEAAAAARMEPRNRERIATPINPCPGFFAFLPSKPRSTISNRTLKKRNASLLRS
jgi:hypothetical protein